MRFDVHRLFNIWPSIEEHLDDIRMVQALSWSEFWSDDGVYKHVIMEKGKTFQEPAPGDRHFRMMQKRFDESKTIFERALLERKGIDADTRYHRVESDEAASDSEGEEEQQAADSAGGVCEMEEEAEQRESQEEEVGNEDEEPDMEEAETQRVERRRKRKNDRRIARDETDATKKGKNKKTKK